MSSGYQEPGGGTASPSTGTAVGSKPIRAWLKVLRNVDITSEPGYGSTFIPKIKTPFEILSTALRLQNPAQTFYTNIESAALAANQSIKVPIITATESGNKKDEVVLLKQGQSLENKTFPTFFDVTETAAPANPSAGTLRIYANSTTHELTQRDSSGTEVKLSDGTGEGGGGGAPTDAQYLTLGVNVGLTNERVLTGSSRISITDAGPGVTATLDIASGSVVDTYIGTHTSTKISITSKGQLNSSIVYTDQANTWGANPQTYAYDTLRILNSGGTFYSQLRSAATANRTPSLPDNSGTIATNDSTTIFTNKTYDATGTGNSLSNVGDAHIASHTSTKISITNKSLLNSQIAYKDESNWMTNSHVADGTFNWAKVSKSGSILDDVADVVITTVASQDILHRNGSSQWVNLAKGSNNTLLGVNGSGNLAYTTIADANIASHTSTKITITSKSQLNSAILYSDVDNALGSHYVDVTEIAAPANPGAGVLRIYANSTTHELTQRDSSGTEKKFSDGSGGSGAPTNSTYLVLSSDGTLSAERIATASSRVTITDGGANSTATFDIGSGSIVDAYIGSHTSTKISITNKSLLNSAIVYNDADNNLGAHYLDVAEIAAPGNPAANHLRLYMHSTDEHLKVKNSAGAVVDLFDVVHGHAFTDLTGSIDTGQIDPNTITDSHIAAHTSTKVTITSKGQLNSSILYGDANQDLGAFYHDIGEIAAPSAPAANKLRVYMDSGDESLRVKNSSNTVFNLFSPTGLVDANIGAHTSTKITITDKSHLPSDTTYNDTAQTLTNKILLDSASNQIGTHSPYTITIYQGASNYFRRNNWDGTVTSAANTDLSAVIDAAIAAISSIGSGNDTVYGGTIFIEKGAYVSTTQLDLTFENAARHGIAIMGEGEGTHIRFQPGGALTDAIKVNIEAYSIERIKFSCNSNVTNVIHAIGVHSTGPSTGRRTDYGKIMWNMFEGNANKYANVAPTAGQTAIFLDGADAGIYWNRIWGNHFGGFETNIKLDGTQTTSVSCRGNTSINSEKHIVISGGSGQHDIDGEWVQGDTNVGVSAVELSGSGKRTSISNITTELHKTGAQCQAILIGSGVQYTFIGLGVSNVHAPTGGQDFVIVRDNSANQDNYWAIGGNDTRTIVNKTINAANNTISNIGDTQITAHTSTKITITSKSLLNSSILYGDQNNTIGANYIDIAEMAAPGNPSAGSIRMWMDSTTHELSIKTNGGTVTKMSDGTGGGGGAPTTAQYVTLATDGTLSAERVLTAGNNISLTDGGAGGNATIDLKLAHSAAAKTSAYTAALTDFWIPVDTTSGGVTITLPTAVGNRGLTFKIWKTNAPGNLVTIDPGTGSETIAGLSTLTFNRQYQVATVYSDGTNWQCEPDVALAYDFTNNIFYTSATYFQMQNVQLLVADTDGSGNYFIVGGNIGASKICTLPDLTANDVFTFNDAAQTLQNKILNTGYMAGRRDGDVAKTANYTMTATDLTVRCDASGGAFTITLPTAASVAGTIYEVKKVDAGYNIVSVATTSSQTIDGLTGWELRQPGDTLVVKSDGSNWISYSPRPSELIASRRTGTSAPDTYYIAGQATAAALGTATAVTANQLYSLPFKVDRVQTIDKVGVNLTTQVAASNVRMGIYKDLNGVPGALVADLGTVATTNPTGLKEITGLTQKLQPGLYWLSAVFSHAPTISYLAAGGITSALGVTSAAALNTAITASFTYAALPSPHTTPAKSTATSQPALFYHFSA